MLGSEPQWIAIYTNPRAEKKVEKNLRDAGFEAYLPLQRELHTWSDRKKWVEMPLLRSYVFVRITSAQLSRIREIGGVSFVIAFKGVVATIPDREIQMMKDFLAAELAVRVRTVEQLHRGARVRIHTGALAGKEGMLVSDCDEGNFAVEISGISMAMIIHVDKELLEVIPEQETPDKPVHRKKYTIR